MPGTKNRRMTGKVGCRVCNHPGADKINTMILNGVPYGTIINVMQEEHPSAAVLKEPALSRHKQNHLMNSAIVVPDSANSNSSSDRVNYITSSYLVERLSVDRSMIPEAVPVSDALRVVIAAGTANILQNPSLVSPQVLVAALDLARKMGLFTGDKQEFDEAWAALASKKGGRKHTRRVTVEETIEEDDALPAEIASSSEDAQDIWQVEKEVYNDLKID